MAGDWIKFEKATLEKPEVAEIAESLGIDDDAVVGKLLRVWAWADEHCNASGVTSVTVMKRLDRRVGVSGFAQAMQKVGWLAIDGNILTFPNFDRHISQTAKERALTSKRVSTHRKRNCNADTVTKTLPEKRREEYIERESAPPVDLPKAISYGNQIGMTKEQVENWWNLRTRDGWTIAGSNGITRPVQSWQHDLATAKGWRIGTNGSNTQQKPKPKTAAEYGI